MSKLGLAVVTSLFLSTPAVADAPDTWINLSELAGRAKELRGQTIKLRSTGDLQLKRSTFFGCAFTSKKKYIAVELTDSSGSVLAYCPKSEKTCAMLDRALNKEPELRILGPKAKVPAKVGSCKLPQVELLKW